MKMTQKQLVIVGSVVAAVVLVGGGAFAVSKMRGQAEPTETAAPKKRVALPVNVISVEKRPDMRITPTADGRSVEFTVEALNMPAKETEIDRSWNLALNKPEYIYISTVKLTKGNSLILIR